MEFFPSLHEIWAIAKASWPLGVLLFIGWFLLQALHHHFFEWSNKQSVGKIAPAMRPLQVAIGWIVGPCLFTIERGVRVRTRRQRG